MKTHLLVAAMVVASFVYGHAADTDPVLMTIDGHDVRISEFEYLFNKNNSQQIQQQSLDEYLQMFIDYKLKVADAEHAGIQNTPEFIKEFETFRNELATPYMRSQEVEDKLLEEAYDHLKHDVYVSHIMLPQDPEQQAVLDSLRTAIIEGKVTFEDAALRSIDRASNQRGGRMGYVVPDRFPWKFEKASYDTKEGEISPVINSGVGYHIIRVEKREPAAGQVLASHILRLTRGKTEEQSAAQKALIDSLYTELQNGADFADLATRFSEDPGSARNGGSLSWFGRGAMVAEFDSISFALKDGEISAPFATNFGYHIVKRFDHKGVPSFDEVRSQLLEHMRGDERAHAPEEAYRAELMNEYGAKLDIAALDRVERMIVDNGGYDSTIIKKFEVMDLPVAHYKGGEVTLADAMANVTSTIAKDAGNARMLITNAASNLLQESVMSLARDRLAETNADYRNLVNEYRDGILLYEISNRNVWDKAAKDTEGLDKFFKANLERYRWESPKFKSYILFATSDSVLTIAKEYADSLSTADPTAFTQGMRKRFGKDIKVERVIAAKGENAITDYLAFGGSKPNADKQSKWTAYAAYKGRILEAPEEAGDVRGAAVTDYQSELDKEWVKKLRKRYKYKVNKKVFEKLKADNQ